MLRFIAEHRPGWSPYSLRRRFLSLRAFYQWCQPEDDPTASIRCRRPPATPKRPYSEAELRRLIAACRTPRDRALVLLMLDCGLRRSEVTRMRGEDIDWTRGEIVVHGKGRRIRLVAPGERTMAALRLCRNGAGPMWWGRAIPLTPDGLYSLVRRIAARAEVEGAYLHRFRTTWANMFLEGTRDPESAQLLMGHSRIEQTLQYAAWSRQQRALVAMRQNSLADRIAG